MSFFLYQLLPERARSAGKKSRHPGHPKDLSVLGSLKSNLYCINMSWILLYRKIICHLPRLFLGKIVAVTIVCQNEKSYTLWLFLKPSVSNTHVLCVALAESATYILCKKEFKKCAKLQKYCSWYIYVLAHGIKHNQSYAKLLLFLLAAPGSVAMEASSDGEDDVENSDKVTETVMNGSMKETLSLTVDAKTETAVFKR